MQLPLVSTLALAASLASLASANPIKTSGESPLEEAAVFALVMASKYGYPALPFAELALPILNHTSSNKFNHTKDLPTPASKAGAFPNVNTLSSTAIIDLSSDDLVVEIPGIPDRYWVLGIYDVYAGNYANIGSTQGSTQGRYRISYRRNKPGVEHHGPEGFYQSSVYSPTAWGILVAQLQVKNGSDVDEVHRLQNEIGMYTVNKPFAGVRRLHANVLTEELSEVATERLMQLTCRIEDADLDRSKNPNWAVSDALQRAGCLGGSYQSQGVDLKWAAEKANKTVEEAGHGEDVIRFDNGWKLEPLQFDSGRYDIRAWTSRVNYLALSFEEALYPIYTEDEELSSESNQGYKLTFNSRPPLKEYGFWSLTAYGPDGNLIANSLNQYSLGSFSNLTYLDGTPVYGEDQDQEGPFDILLQSQQPASGTSNWLPTPSGKGKISFALRFYGPQDPLRDGSWPYPLVEKVDAKNG
ncbi:DUF1254-domain-containing protein [Penicillium odoratum]|uniref:DUF1254-domain-containing protein n=1 Tax=Penicillium odoratum TaxID=1167516 RepID=UPI002548F41A|nr:DUF1254-domain-containing protein [Penicillium odoratum]KAJ5759587.1 DUF1254-domain-containing protein [Penicillium odoratum]